MPVCFHTSFTRVNNKLINLSGNNPVIEGWTMFSFAIGLEVLFSWELQVPLLFEVMKDVTRMISVCFIIVIAHWVHYYCSMCQELSEFCICQNPGNPGPCLQPVSQGKVSGTTAPHFAAKTIVPVTQEEKVEDYVLPHPIWTEVR